MADLSKVLIPVLPDMSRFSGEVRRGIGRDQGLARVGAEHGKSYGDAVVAGASKPIRSGFGALAKVATASFAAIGVGVFKAGSFGLKIASQNEQAQISFETMLGSAAKAKKFLGDLQSFAAKTPFEFPELQTAASSLISVGVDARKVIPIMTSLGNATAGMGTGSEGVKRATVALQQMSAAGKITGEDLNQLRDAGVPVFDLLAAATGKSKAKVAELAQAGKLGKKELDQLFKALETGKGLERFSGLMDKQSASLSGMLSTFKDTFGQGLASAIAPALPTIKQGLQAASDQAGHFFNVLAGKGTTKDFAATTGQVALGLRAMVAAFKEGDVTSTGMIGKFERVGVAARQFQTGIQALVAAYKEGDVTSDGFIGAMERIGVQLRKAHDWIANADFRSLAGDTKELGTQAKGLDFSKISAQLQSVDTAKFGDGLRVAGAGVKFLADHLGLLVKALPVLIGLFIAYKAAQAAANVADLVSVPVKVAQVASNIILARSIKSLAASNVENTVATGAATVAAGVNTAVTNAGTAAIERGRLATIAAAVAQKVIAAATKVWAGVQLVLNAVMSANPIALVIIGITALIAVVVLVATKTRFFQTVWAAAWGAIKGAFDVTFNWIKTHWPLILAILTGPIGLAVVAIVKSWDRIKATAAAMWEGIKATFRVGVAVVVGVFLGMVGAILTGAAKAFGWVPGLGGKLKDAAAKFVTFRNQINAALAGVKSKEITVTAKASVLMGQGLSRADAIATSLHRATGGPVFGAGSATSDSIPAMLSNGEHVLTAREVRGFGGHSAVAQMRKSAASQAVGFAAGGPVDFRVISRTLGLGQFRSDMAAVNRFATDLVTGAAKRANATGGFSANLAGVVNFAKSMVGANYAWGSSGPKSRGFDCSGFVSNLVEVAKGMPLYRRLFATGSMSSYSWPNHFGGAFKVGWTTNAGGGIGHTAATVNGVNMESRGGDGVVVGAGSRGANQSIFNQHAFLARGGPVLPGDPPFDILDPRGRHYVPGLFSALQSRMHTAMAGGGVIREPVLGIGRSGRSYSFGERGPETVVPGVAGGVHIHIHGAVGEKQAVIGWVQQGLREAQLKAGKPVTI